MILQADLGTHAMPVAKVAAVAPADAAAMVLMRYLGELRFSSGADAFRLEGVLDEWPSFGDEFRAPCASVLAMPGDDTDQQLVPEMLEETAGCHGDGTVLWKTEEMSIRFQVDFWAATKPQRAAIHAGLQAAFSPTEVRHGVMLPGVDEYWGLPVRAVLEAVERMMTKTDAEAGDWRLRTVIRCDVDAVHLRRVTRLEPRVIIDPDQS